MVACPCLSAGGVLRRREDEERALSDCERAGAQTQRTREREVAVQRWRSILSDVGPWCDFARSLEDGGDSFSQSVVDVLATRMTATLMARASAIDAYRRWTRGRSRCPWPLTESAAYEYVANLREHKAPATKPTSFYKAVLMVGHLCGVDGWKDARGSKRVSGSCWASVCRKRIAERASPFTVSQVRLFQVGD